MPKQGHRRTCLNIRSCMNLRIACSLQHSAANKSSKQTPTVNNHKKKVQWLMAGHCIIITGIRSIHEKPPALTRLWKCLGSWQVQMTQTRKAACLQSSSCSTSFGGGRSGCNVTGSRLDTTSRGSKQGDVLSAHGLWLLAVFAKIKCIMDEHTLRISVRISCKTELMTTTRVIARATEEQHGNGSLKARTVTQASCSFPRLSTEYCCCSNCAKCLYKSCNNEFATPTRVFFCKFSASIYAIKCACCWASDSEKSWFVMACQWAPAVSWEFSKPWCAENELYSLYCGHNLLPDPIWLRYGNP